jgi:hypothetical protein
MGNINKQMESGTMKEAHKKLAHFLLSIMLTDKLWAHTYLMCESDFDTQLAINKMMDLIESKGIQITITIVLQTRLETMTADRIRRLALDKSDPKQEEALDKATKFAFCLWFSDDKIVNDEIETIH